MPTRCCLPESSSRWRARRHDPMWSGGPVFHVLSERRFHQRAPNLLLQSKWHLLRWSTSACRTSSRCILRPDIDRPDQRGGIDVKGSYQGTTSRGCGKGLQDRRRGTSPSMSTITQACHPERSAATSWHLTKIIGAESKDPEGLSLTMPLQGILTRWSFPHIASWEHSTCERSCFVENALMRHSCFRHSRDPSTRPRVARTRSG